MNKRSAPPSLFKPCITASAYEPALHSFRHPLSKYGLRDSNENTKSPMLPGSMRGSPASQ